MLADELAALGVGPGSLVTAAGAIGWRWFAASWAAAKLGAGLAGLPPGPGAGVPGAQHIPQDDEPHGGRAVPAPRRLSGTHALPDSVIFSGSGRAVRRSFTPEQVGCIGPVLADLVARTRAAPGTTLAAVGSVADSVITFHANVVLVGGGRVVTAPTAAEALALAAGHGANAATLAPADLAGLSDLAPAAHDALDVMAIQTLVTGGAAFPPRAHAVAENLFGPEAVVDVYSTADTGAVAVRAGDDDHHVLLTGVEARLGAGRRLEICSPLAAARGWVATGDRATLGAEGELRLA